MSPQPGDLQSLADASRNQQDAAILSSSMLRDRKVLRMVLALDTAQLLTNPLRVGFPFNSVFAESATDNNTTVNLALTSLEAQNIQNYLALKVNETVRLDSPVDGGFLFWSAQPGKSLTLIFFLGVQLFPGAYLQQITGGVNLLTGSSLSTIGNVSIGIAPAQLILAADSTRKRTTLTNLSGTTFYLGGATDVVGISGAVAGSHTGIPIPVGSSYEITHQGPIYGVTDSGSALVAVNTEV